MGGWVAAGLRCVVVCLSAWWVGVAAGYGSGPESGQPLEAPGEYLQQLVALGVCDIESAAAGDSLKCGCWQSCGFISTMGPSLALKWRLLLPGASHAEDVLFCLLSECCSPHHNEHAILCKGVPLSLMHAPHVGQSE